jgi:glutamate synthase domain-containing protein 2
MAASLSVNLEKLAKLVNVLLPVTAASFFLLGHYISFYFHFVTVAFVMITGLNFYFRHLQRRHALLRNFGVIAQSRYVIEGIGPELRQYLFADDTTERPFNRLERAEVYRKSKGVDSSAAFGSQLAFDTNEIKLRHSMYPLDKKDVKPFKLVLGEERPGPQYELTCPVMISAMSYGSLSKNAVRALARGAKKAGATMNTGEGGYPKYHLMEGCNLIFQMGTAKFGVRNHEGHLDDDRLAKLAAEPSIKMIEIKLSQGAKPGKGGILPKEKITDEIAELRGVPQGRDVLSPPSHFECKDAKSTVAFLRRVKEVSGIPVGLKLCLGRESELREVFLQMKRQRVFPDYISVDGAEGGTGAAPKSFMDDIGVPLYAALPSLMNLLDEERMREEIKVFAAGKLINPARQFFAMALGADAIYTARGFMLAMGCIQALQCNANTCPVGITTHDPHLMNGLDIEDKSNRVMNYVHSLMHDHVDMLAALGCATHQDIGPDHLYAPSIARLRVLPNYAETTSVKARALSLPPPPVE